MSEVTRRELAVLLAGMTAMSLAGCTAASTTDTTAATPSTRTAGSTRSTSTAAAAPAFDRHQHSIDDPSSLWVVVNKLRPLGPKTYAPDDLVAVDVPHTNPPILRKAAAAAVVTMFAAAKRERGLSLASNSTYRPYSDQRSVYDQDVSQNGRASADRLTLRPGYSEHQTGWAIDIGTASAKCDLDACLGDLPEGKWLAANAWRFGFLLRYRADEEKTTGIEYEPWHFRYLGLALAKELHTTGTATLEDFFGLPAAPGYA